MKKHLLILIMLLCGCMFAQGQTWIKSAQTFQILDPLFRLQYFKFSIPAIFYVDSAGTFVSDDGGLFTTYEVDYDPSMKTNCVDSKGNVDLRKYASTLTTEELYYMETGKISKKVIAPKVETINGVKVLVISFDYEEVFDDRYSQGRGYIYLMTARGDGQNVSNDYDVVVKMSFIYDNNEIPVQKQVVHKEIIKTISRVPQSSHYGPQTGHTTKAGSQ